MRLLVFCGQRSAIERFDMAGWPIIVGQYPPAQRSKILAAFKADPNGRLAVDRCMTTGWRAPHDTFILFDPSWPFPKDSPYTIQAVARRDINRPQDIAGLQIAAAKAMVPGSSAGPKASDTE